jgi:hypothetical protein
MGNLLLLFLTLPAWARKGKQITRGKKRPLHPRILFAAPRAVKAFCGRRIWTEEGTVEENVAWLPYHG